MMKWLNAITGYCEAAQESMQNPTGDQIPRWEVYEEIIRLCKTLSPMAREEESRGPRT